LRIAGLYEVNGRRIHRRPFIAHRSGIIDHDSHCHRNILAAKRRDLLLLAIFEDREIAATKIGYKVVLSSTTVACSVTSSTSL
jgi:hypothetical protein